MIKLNDLKYQLNLATKLNDLQYWLNLTIKLNDFKVMVKPCV